MNRRKFLAIGAGMATATVSGVMRAGMQNTNKSSQPNILWLDAEDLSPDLACYGTQLVKTPNLDRLADQGVRFDNAFTTSPVCSPSRTTMITGVHQTTLGAHHHRPLSHYKEGISVPLPDPVKPLTQYLREAGYFCVNGEALTDGERGKLGYSFDYDGFNSIFDGTDWNQREAGQPFFAEIHFTETHRTFEHDPDNPIDPDAVDLPPYYPDHPLARLDWALYLETVQILDKKVGQVLQQLEDDGLTENTVVFFNSDHGRPMLRGKQWLYDSGIHVPLIVRWPGVIVPGSVRSDLISAVDYASTWLSIADAKKPDYLQGYDMFAENRQNREFIFAARDRCDEADYRIRAIRGERYKYIRNYYPERPFTQFSAYKKREYPVLTLMQYLEEQGALEEAQSNLMKPHRSPEELYDLENDPDEVHNLADSNDHQDILNRYSNMLTRWIYESDDKGRIPELPEDAAYIDRLEYEEFVQEMQERGLSPDISHEEYLCWWEDKLSGIKTR